MSLSQTVCRWPGLLMFFQETADGTELSEGLIQVDGLKPLTEYEFQMRTCNSTSGRTHADMPRSITSKRTICSKWSPAVRGRSHGKGKLTILNLYTTEEIWFSLSSLIQNITLNYLKVHLTSCMCGGRLAARGKTGRRWWQFCGR